MELSIVSYQQLSHTIIVTPLKTNDQKLYNKNRRVTLLSICNFQL